MRKQFFLILLITFSLSAGINCNSFFFSNLANEKSLQIRDNKDAELIDAIKSENFEKSKELLEKGASANSSYKISETSEIYETALGLAVRNKNLEIARLLLEHKADVNKSYIGGSYHTLNFRNAVYNQDLAMVKLLADYKADMEKDADSFVPTIFYAGNKEMLDFLVKQGFDINVIGGEGKTCLIEAVFSNDVDLVKAVLQHKPNNLNNKTVAIKVTDYKEMTALQLAKAYGNKEIIEALKKAGAKR